MTTVAGGIPVGVIRNLLPWGILLLGAILAWSFWPRPDLEVGKSVQLPPAKEVRTVEKIIERVEYVKVYPSETKKKLKLPEAVVQNQAQKVIATGKLEAQERPYTLSAVLDTATGEAEVYARPDPLPWIAPGKRTVIGIAYGIGQDGQTGKFYGQRDLLQIKALYAGARAEIDQQGRWWVGASVEYRF